jgi:hypothetical protein
MSRLVALIVCWMWLALQPLAAHAAEDSARVQVADPYIELHTGPGRGYPVFHVSERGEWVVITLRRTTWYQVRTDKGIEGWVNQRQLVATLNEAGERVAIAGPGGDDYLNRRGDFGGGLGRFKGEPSTQLFGSWRLSDTLSLEGATGQVQGVFSGSSFWHVGLGVQPWSDQRLSPYFGIGLGKFRNFPNQSLVDAIPVNVKMAQASLGLRYHLGARFIARLDFSLYTAFLGDSRSAEYRAVSAGIGFFF